MKAEKYSKEKKRAKLKGGKKWQRWQSMQENCEYLAGNDSERGGMTHSKGSPVRESKAFCSLCMWGVCWTQYATTPKKNSAREAQEAKQAEAAGHSDSRHV